MCINVKVRECVRFFMFLKSLKVECTFSVAIGLIKWSPLKNNHIIEACIVTACVPTSHWFIFFCLKHFSIHNTHIYIYMYIETIIIPKPYDFNNNWMFNNMNTKKNNYMVLCSQFKPFLSIIFASLLSTISDHCSTFRPPKKLYWWGETIVFAFNSFKIPNIVILDIRNGEFSNKTLLL